MAVSITQFQVQPSSGVPIYRQIIDQVKAFAAAGQLQAGDLLPSTRALSAGLEVNMMTVSKAYSKLEADGVVERVRGRGMRMLPTKPTSVASRKREIADLMEPIIAQASQLGLTEEHIHTMVKQLFRKQDS